MRRLPAGVLLCVALTASQGLFATSFGRISGSVTDSEGNPLLGATVLLAGADVADTVGLQTPLDRVFTNARGDFSIEHLAPGWYSLQVISSTRLPAFRNRIQVKAGETSKEAFALGDVLSHIHLQDPKPNLDAWGNEWKWILRTSAATRPVLRYRRTQQASKKAEKQPPLPSQYLVAMLPGSSQEDAIDSDSGIGAVMAYFHPLDENSDVLVAGSVGGSTAGGSSLIASYRKNMLERDGQEVSVVIRQLQLEDGQPMAAAGPDRGLMDSRAMVLRYTQTHQLSGSLTLTTGVEVKYLDSERNASVAQPEVSFAYKMDPDTVLTVSYGTMAPDQSPALLDRISDLDAFPRVSLRGDRPRLERQDHAEVRLERKLGARSRIEVATYHDDFHDVAVWSIGGVQDLDSAAASGNVLFQAGGNRAILNAGRYTSSGVRAAYERKLGSHTGIGVMYAAGNALVVGGADAADSGIAIVPSNLPQNLHTRFTQSFSGKVSTYLPVFKTEIVTSYGWLPPGRVTLVDPYGQDTMQIEPYLGIQVRQPLPKIDILPFHVIAVADFRNLLGQGSVAVAHSNGEPVFLTPYYRSVRGGFAVQF